MADHFPELMRIMLRLRRSWHCVPLGNRSFPGPLWTDRGNHGIVYMGGVLGGSVVMWEEQSLN